MRQYAFFVLALFATAARAATLPNNIQAAQESLQKLREGFITQIDTLTENIETFLNGNRTNVSPVEARTKADLESIRAGLTTIKNDFTKRLNILEDYMQSEVVNNNLERSRFSSDVGKFMQTFITNFETNVQNGMATVTNSFNNYVVQDQNTFNLGQQPNIDSSVSVSSAEAPVAVAPAEVPATVTPAETLAPIPPSGAPALTPPLETQADGLPIPSVATQQSTANELIKLLQTYEKILNVYTKYFKKPVEVIEAVGAQVGIKLTKTLLQDNAFNQRIAETVHSQDPEKLRDLENVKVVSDVLLSEDEKTKLSPDSGDSNNSNDVGMKAAKDSEPVNEVPKESLGRSSKDGKTEAVVEKTD